jgi:ribosome-associated protein
MTEPETDDPQERPSKSSRKRAAHARQTLGAELVAMREAELAALPLNDILRTAIDEARRLRGHGALSRQYQYIGKLMRDVDLIALDDAMGGLVEAQKARARLRK